METEGRSLEEIAQDMKKAKKSKYYKDKDGNDRIIKGNRLMSKKDITKILNLYCYHSEKLTNIFKKRSIRYEYNRIKKLINKY